MVEVILVSKLVKYHHTFTYINDEVPVWHLEMFLIKTVFVCNSHQVILSHKALHTILIMICFYLCNRDFNSLFYFHWLSFFLHTIDPCQFMV